MVIAPAKQPCQIGRLDVLVDVVFLAQPLRGTRVHRHFGEGTLAVLERTDPAFSGGVSAQCAPPCGDAPTEECADAIDQVRFHRSLDRFQGTGVGNTYRQHTDRGHFSSSRPLGTASTQDVWRSGGATTVLTSSALPSGE